MKIGHLTASLGLDTSGLETGIKKASSQLMTLSKEMTTLKEHSRKAMSPEAFEGVKSRMQEIQTKMKELGYDYSEFGQTSTTAVQQTSSSVTEQKGIIEDIVNTIKEYEEAMVKATSTEEIDIYKNKIREAKFDLQELARSGKKAGVDIAAGTDIATMSYGEMRAELFKLRRTPLIGLSAAQSTEVKKRMAELTDGVSNYSKQLKMAGGSATDTMINGLSGIMGAATGVVSVFGIFGEKNEKLHQTMSGLMGVTMSLNSVHGLMKAQTFQIIGARIKDAAATALQSTATVGLTGVTKVLRTVMLSLPFVAIAAAVTALVYGIYKFTKGTKDAREENKRWGNIMKDFGESSAAPLAGLQAIGNKLKATQGNQKEFNQAVNEWNTDYGKKYNNSLLTTRSSLNDIEDALQRVRTGIIATGMATAISKEVEGIFKEHLKDIDAYNQLLEIRRQAEKELSGVDDLRDQADIMAKWNKEEKEMLHYWATQGIDIENGRKEMGKINNLLDTQNHYAQISEQIQGGITTEKQKQLDAYERLTAEISELENKQRVVLAEGKKMEHVDIVRLRNLIAQKNEIEEQIKLMQEASLTTSSIPTSLSPMETTFQPDVNVGYYEAAKMQLQELQTELQNTLKLQEDMSEQDWANVESIKEQMNVLTEQITSMDSMMIEKTTLWQEAWTGLTDMMASTFTDAISAMGEALVTGEMTMKSVMTTMLKSIQNIINALLTQAIAAMIAGESTKGIIGLVTAGIGIAGILALFSSNKNAGNSEVQGLWTGGTVTQGGAFMVGERGPEMVNLPAGSAVTPNHGMGGELVGRLSGRDIEISLERTKAVSRRG